MNSLQRHKNFKPVRSYATLCGNKCWEVKNHRHPCFLTYRFFAQQYCVKNVVVKNRPVLITSHLQVCTNIRPFIVIIYGSS